MHWPRRDIYAQKLQNDLAGIHAGIDKAEKSQIALDIAIKRLETIAEGESLEAILAENTLQHIRLVLSDD